MTSRRIVYVVGAGFSAGLGYPLTSDLLFRLWPRLTPKNFLDDLTEVIRFHHPGFDSKNFLSFPNVEQLLSEMQVNEQLFDASRQYEGKFTKADLKRIQTDLLLHITRWFHDLSREVEPSDPNVPWLAQFRDQVVAEEAAIISFNWDLILDELLFEERISDESYGFSSVSTGAPLLLKPHGSLNWFEEPLGRKLKEDKKRQIFGSDDNDQVFAFRKFREPQSTKGRLYTPLIVPPVYLKNFEKPIFKALWQNCTEVLSKAKRVVFLGYSMPEADMHARFIVRCGFHNQTDGTLKSKGRNKKTGPADVTVVNPDIAAAKRIASVVGPYSKCTWVSTPVSEWVMAQS